MIELLVKIKEAVQRAKEQDQIALSDSHRTDFDLRDIFHLRSFQSAPHLLRYRLRSTSGR